MDKTETETTVVEPAPPVISPLDALTFRVEALERAMKKLVARRDAPVGAPNDPRCKSNMWSVKHGKGFRCTMDGGHQPKPCDFGLPKDEA